MLYNPGWPGCNQEDTWCRQLLVQASQPNSQATQLAAERKNLELHYVQVLGSEQVLQPGRQLMGLPLIKATPLVIGYKYQN